MSKFSLIVKYFDYQVWREPRNTLSVWKPDANSRTQRHRIDVYRNSRTRDPSADINHEGDFRAFRKK